MLSEQASYNISSLSPLKKKAVKCGRMEGGKERGRKGREKGKETGAPKCF